MNLKNEVWRQLRKTIREIPNDMELGYFIRRETLLHEHEEKRNKRIHIENDINDSNR